MGINAAPPVFQWKVTEYRGFGISNNKAHVLIFNLNNCIVHCLHGIYPELAALPVYLVNTILCTLKFPFPFSSHSFLPGLLSEPLHATRLRFLSSPEFGLSYPIRKHYPTSQTGMH